MSSWCQRKVGAGDGPRGLGDTGQGGQQHCRLFGRNSDQHGCRGEALFARFDPPKPRLARQPFRADTPANIQRRGECFDAGVHAGRADKGFVSRSRPACGNACRLPTGNNFTKSRIARGEILRAVIEGDLLAPYFDAPRRHPTARPASLVQHDDALPSGSQRRCSGKPRHTAADDEIVCMSVHPAPTHGKRGCFRAPNAQAQLRPAAAKIAALHPPSARAVPTRLRPAKAGWTAW